MYLYALTWRERNAASKAGKYVVSMCSIVGYQSLPQHYPCRSHELSVAELPGLPPSKTGGKGTACFFSFPFYSNYTLLWCLHLLLVWVCAVFSRKMLVSEVGGAFGNVFGWVQAKQGRNYLCEMDGVFFWLNIDEWRKRMERHNSFLLIL